MSLGVWTTLLAGKLPDPNILGLFGIPKVYYLKVWNLKRVDPSYDIPFCSMALFARRPPSWASSASLDFEGLLPAPPPVVMYFSDGFLTM